MHGYLFFGHYYRSHFFLSDFISSGYFYRTSTDIFSTKISGGHPKYTMEQYRVAAVRSAEPDRRCWMLNHANWSSGGRPEIFFQDGPNYTSCVAHVMNRNIWRGKNLYLLLWTVFTLKTISQNFEPYHCLRKLLGRARDHYWTSPGLPSALHAATGLEPYQTQRFSNRNHCNDIGIPTPKPELKLFTNYILLYKQPCWPGSLKSLFVYIISRTCSDVKEPRP